MVALIDDVIKASAKAEKAGFKLNLQLFGNKAAKTNPFKGKTPSEIDEMFRAKGYKISGNDPVNGFGGYVNPKTGRSYHIDPHNSFNEVPHIDVNRLRSYKGPLEKKKLYLEE